MTANSLADTLLAKFDIKKVSLNGKMRDRLKVIQMQHGVCNKGEESGDASKAPGAPVPKETPEDDGGKQSGDASKAPGAPDKPETPEDEAHKDS